MPRPIITDQVNGGDKVESARLDQLAQRIEGEHKAVATALQSALGHAIAAGELLIEAKRQVGHGQWLLWLKANCAVPARTAAHYMALAKSRKGLCDQNGNTLPLSVRQALDALKHPSEPDGSGHSEWGDYAPFNGWGRMAWDKRFSEALEAVTHITQFNPPAPRYVVKAVREGKTPGLTARVLREVIALLVRYAEALEAEEHKHPDGFETATENLGVSGDL